MINISPIKEIEIRSSKIPGVVSLAQGIPSFDTPLCIKKRVIDALLDGKTAKYSLSPGLLELREAIEHDLAKHNIFYDFEREIIVTAGSIEAITATFLGLLKPGDEVLIPDPSYTSYQAAIKAARAKPVFFPLSEKRGWALDVEQIKNKITHKTKAILFSNPNNPTGTIYTRKQLLEIAELAEYHNLYILSDEVYRDFIYSDEDFYSLAQFPDFRKRIIYIFSFSKTYAMTGWRVAYLAADREITERIIGVHDAMVTCAPVVSQWAALAALEMAGPDVAEFRKIFIKRRDLMCRWLDKLSIWFSYQNPDAAYFVFPKFSNRTKDLIEEVSSRHKDIDYEVKSHQKNSMSWKFALELLYHGKVAVVPGLAFGPGGEDHIRLCFGRDEKDIDQAMSRMKKFFEFQEKLISKSS